MRNAAHNDAMAEAIEFHWQAKQLQSSRSMWVGGVKEIATRLEPALRLREAGMSAGSIP